MTLEQVLLLNRDNREERWKRNQRLAKILAVDPFGADGDPEAQEPFPASVLNGYLSKLNAPIVVNIYKAKDECGTPTALNNRREIKFLDFALTRRGLDMGMVEFAVHPDSRIYPYAQTAWDAIAEAESTPAMKQVVEDSNKASSDLDKFHASVPREEALARGEGDELYLAAVNASNAYYHALRAELKKKGFPVDVRLRHVATEIYDIERTEEVFKTYRLSADTGVFNVAGNDVTITATMPAQEFSATISTTPPFPTRARLLPLYNAPEAQTMASLTSNYGRQWFEVDLRERQAIFRRGKTWEAVLDCGGLEGSWDDPHTEEAVASKELEEAIWAKVDEFKGVGSEDTFVMLYILARLVESPEGSVDIGFTELLDLEGKTKLGAADREARAREYDRGLRLWDSFKPVVRRTWRDPKTGKKRDIEAPTPMFLYQGPFYPGGQGPLTGMYSGPAGYTVVDSTTTKEFREDPTLCHQFGVIMHLAHIPHRKPAGEWARCMGLTAAQLVRNNAKNSGAKRNITRRELLTRHPPKTSPEEILNGKNPGRALDYWEQAIAMLKEARVIESVEEPPLPTGRKSRKDGWLDQSVTVTLAGAWAEGPKKVFDRVTAQREKAAKRRKKPPQKE
jgi:hypothetical protein